MYRRKAAAPAKKKRAESPPPPPVAVPPAAPEPVLAPVLKQPPTEPLRLELAHDADRVLAAADVGETA